MYYIFSDTQVLSELRSELATLDESRDVQRIVALPYLDATVKEVLRIAPIFLFTMRRVTRARSFGGIEFAANTFVATCIYLVHHREDLWDEPERFNPARFLNRHHPASHFLPFGDGTRHCVGAALASFEMKLVLARLLLRADFQIDKGYVPKAKWIGNFIGPSEGVPVTFNPRPSP